MTWILNKADDSIILREISNQTDRGAALIATAYLEERLTTAIKARTNRDEAIENRLYKGSGPLASFSARIDLGLLIGIYEPKVHRFLRTIKDIRNAFAHDPDPITFEAQKIRDLCTNLNLSLNAILDIKSPNGEIEKIEFDVRPDGTAITAFLNAIKFLLLALNMEIKVGPPRVPAPPVIPPLEKIESSTKNP